MTDDDDIHRHHAATADKKFTIQPMHETIAVAQTDLPDGTEIIMTPIDNPNLEDLSIAPCVAVVHSGTIPFRCVNTGISPLTVSKDSIIGTIQAMPTAPIINAIPFVKFTEGQEYSHDLRCHRNQPPSTYDFLTDIDDTVYKDRDQYYQDQYDDSWSTTDEHEQNSIIETNRHQRDDRTDWQEYLANLHQYFQQNTEEFEDTQDTIQAELQPNDNVDIQHIINDELDRKTRQQELKIVS